MKQKLMVKCSFVVTFLAVAALHLVVLSFDTVNAAPPEPTPSAATDIVTALQPYRATDAGSSQPDGCLLKEAIVTPEMEEQPIGALDTRTLYPIADATVLEGYPNVNLGSTTDMWAGYDVCLDPDGEIARSLIRFDISSLPANVCIGKATLRVRLITSCDYEGASRTITTYRITSSWSESSVTWNNRPGYGNSYGSRSIAHGVWGWYEFDVTNLVKAWYGDTYANHGIMLRGPEVLGWRGFGTRESSYRPQLVTEYEPCTPPTISGLPNQTLEVNTTRDNAIDLWDYANDAQSSDSDLTFRIDNTPNSNAGVSIDSNRYIDINPAPNWAGQTDVVIRVTDPGGLYDTDTFRVTVTNSAPVISGLPDLTLEANSSLDNAIDLCDYTSDAESTDSDLTFAIDNAPDPNAGVSIDSNCYVDINPAPCWEGQTDVVIRVTDPGGLSDTDTFRIIVTNTAPVIAGLPDQALEANDHLDNAIDLWAYASDAESTDSDLTFTIYNTSNTNAGVSIDSNRYVDINPTPGWAGQTDVVIRVTDPCGRYDSDTFSVDVSESETFCYLPIILCRHSAGPPSTPVLDPIDNSDGDGNYTVRWNSVSEATEYILQEDNSASFTSPKTAYSGTRTSTTITNKDVGTYYYRVQATNSSGSSPWSNVVSVQVTQPSTPTPTPCSATVYIKNNCSCGLTITGMGSPIYVSANSSWFGTHSPGTYYVRISGSCIYPTYRTWNIDCGFNSITVNCS